MIKIFLYIIVVVMFSGCMSTKSEKIVYKKYTKPSITTKKYTIPKRVALSGSIRGKVEELFYDGNNWEFFIKSTDTSNGKLKEAKFSYEKRIAQRGDEIYAILKEGKLTEYFLINKTNFKQEKTQKVQKSVTKQKTIAYKRTKKRQILGVPSSESISLD